MIANKKVPNIRFLIVIALIGIGLLAFTASQAGAEEALKQQLLVDASRISIENCVADPNMQCDWNEKASMRAARVGKQCDWDKTALMKAARMEKESTGSKKQKYRDIIGQFLAADTNQQVKCKITGRLEQIDLTRILTTLVINWIKQHF